MPELEKYTLSLNADLSAFHEALRRATETLNKVNDSVKQMGKGMTKGMQENALALERVDERLKRVQKNTEGWLSWLQKLGLSLLGGAGVVVGLKLLTSWLFNTRQAGDAAVRVLASVTAFGMGFARAFGDNRLAANMGVFVRQLKNFLQASPALEQAKERLAGIFGESGVMRKISSSPAIEGALKGIKNFAGRVSETAKNAVSAEHGITALNSTLHKTAVRVGVATGAMEGLRHITGSYTGAVTVLSVALTALVGVFQVLVGVMGGFIQGVGSAFLRMPERYAETFREVQGASFRFQTAMRGLIQQMGEESVGTLEDWNEWMLEFGHRTGRSRVEIEDTTGRLVEMAMTLKLNKEEMRRLLEVAANYAAQNREDIYPVVQSITSALWGYTQAAARLGVNLSEAEVATSRYAQATGKAWEAMTAEERARIRLNVLFEQASTVERASGEYLKTYGGAVMAVNAALVDLYTTIGRGSGEVLVKFYEILLKVIDGLKSLPEPVIKSIGTIQALLGTVLYAIGSFMKWSATILGLVFAVRALTGVYKILDWVSGIFGKNLTAHLNTLVGLHAESRSWTRFALAVQVMTLKMLADIVRASVKWMLELSGVQKLLSLSGMPLTAVFTRMASGLKSLTIALLSLLSLSNLVKAFWALFAVARIGAIVSGIFMFITVLGKLWSSLRIGEGLTGRAGGALSSFTELVSNAFKKVGEVWEVLSNTLTTGTLTILWGLAQLEKKFLSFFGLSTEGTERFIERIENALLSFQQTTTGIAETANKAREEQRRHEEELTRAMTLFGVQNRETLEAMSEKAKESFETLRESGRFTAEELARAYVEGVTPAILSVRELTGEERKEFARQEEILKQYKTRQAEITREHAEEAKRVTRDLEINPLRRLYNDFYNEVERLDKLHQERLIQDRGLLARKIEQLQHELVENQLRIITEVNGKVAEITKDTVGALVVELSDRMAEVRELVNTGLVPSERGRELMNRLARDTVRAYRDMVRDAQLELAQLFGHTSKVIELQAERQLQMQREALERGLITRRQYAEAEERIEEDKYRAMEEARRGYENRVKSAYDRLLEALKRQAEFELKTTGQTTVNIPWLRGELQRRARERVYEEVEQARFELEKAQREQQSFEQGTREPTYRGNIEALERRIASLGETYVQLNNQVREATGGFINSLRVAGEALSSFAGRLYDMARAGPVSVKLPSPTEATHIVEGLLTGRQGTAGPETKGPEEKGTIVIGSRTPGVPGSETATVRIPGYRAKSN